MSELLSHRLRGFGEPDSTEQALVKACESKIKYLEIDTRVSSDGIIYVFHDSFIKIQGKTYVISKTKSNFLQNYQHSNGEKLLNLERLFEILSNLAPRNKILCVDIKDFGYESEHLELIRKYNLEDKVVFISWIPQTLIKLKELNTICPLILSQINLVSYGFLGRFLNNLIQNLKIKFSNYVILGENKAIVKLNSLSKGFQHLYLSYKLPDILINILSSNNGGICIPTYSLNNRIQEFVKSNNLKLWVFTVNDPKKYSILNTNSNIDVIFSDNANKLLKTNEIEKYKND